MVLPINFFGQAFNGFPEFGCILCPSWHLIFRMEFCWNKDLSLNLLILMFILCKLLFPFTSQCSTFPWDTWVDAQKMNCVRTPVAKFTETIFLYFFVSALKWFYCDYDWNLGSHTSTTFQKIIWGIAANMPAGSETSVQTSWCVLTHLLRWIWQPMMNSLLHAEVSSPKSEWLCL